MPSRTSRIDAEHFHERFVPVIQIFPKCKALAFPKSVAVCIVPKNHQKDFSDAFRTEGCDRLFKEPRSDPLASMVFTDRQVVNAASSAVMPGKYRADDLRSFFRHK